MLLIKKGEQPRPTCFACGKLCAAGARENSLCPNCNEKANAVMLAIMDESPACRDRRLKRYRNG